MKKAFYALILSLLLIPSLVLGADTLPKALDYIVSMQEPNGAWSRLKEEFPPETEPTSWAVKVLAMNGLEKEKVDKGIAFILKDQKPNGDWNNNTAHTAFALMALSQVKKGQVPCMNAVEYLRRVQDAAGGFKRIGTEGPPLTLYTSLVLCALAELGYPKEDATVKKALEWLTGCQNPDGGYGMPKGSPSMAASTGFAVRALLAYEADPCIRARKEGGGVGAQGSETFRWFCYDAARAGRPGGDGIRDARSRQAERSKRCPVKSG